MFSYIVYSYITLVQTRGLQVWELVCALERGAWATQSRAERGKENTKYSAENTCTKCDCASEDAGERGASLYIYEYRLRRGTRTG